MVEKNRCNLFWQWYTFLYYFAATFISTDFFFIFFLKYLCRVLLIQCTLKYSLHINHLRGTKSIDTCTGEPFFEGVVHSMTWATYIGMAEWENYVRLGHLRARCTIEGCKRGSKFMLPAMVKTNLLIGLERTWEKKTSSFLQDKLPGLRGLSQTQRPRGSNGSMQFINQVQLF